MITGPEIDDVFDTCESFPSCYALRDIEKAAHTAFDIPRESGVASPSSLHVADPSCACASLSSIRSDDTDKNGFLDVDESKAMVKDLQVIAPPYVFALHGLLRPFLTGDCDGLVQATADKAHVEKRRKVCELKSLKAKAARKALQAMADEMEC